MTGDDGRRPRDLARSRMWLWLIAALAIVGAAAAVALVLRGNAQATALFRTDPEAIAAQPSLLRFADDRAKPAYRAHCAGCHGADLRGDHGGGVPDLIDADWLYGEGRVADVEQSILYGIRSDRPKAHNLASMPAFSRPAPAGSYAITPLAPGEISDLVAYLHAIEGSPADPAAGARGMALYRGKGQCADCHGADAGGDTAIGAPNLNDRVWLYGDGSTASMTRTLLEGRHGVCPAWIGKLPHATVRALAVYIVHQARQPRRSAP